MDDLPPLIKFHEAEQIGGELHDRWVLMSSAKSALLARDDMAWADIVQFCLRRASEVVRDRPDPACEPAVIEASDGLAAE